MKLRNYQEKGLSEIWDYLFTQNNKSCIYQLPTGGGKTVVLNSIISRLKGRCLVLAHRKELITQAADKYGQWYDDETGIVMSGFAPCYSAKVQYGSVQTIAAKYRKFKKQNGAYKRIDKAFVEMMSEIELIIVDEAHLARAKSYMDIFEKCPNAKILGVTATPYRLNGLGFTDIFTHLILGCQVKELEKIQPNGKRFLLPANNHIKPLEFDLEQIKTIGGDYSPDELSEAMSKNKVMGDAVSEWRLKANGRKTFCFCVNIAHSKAVAERYNKEGIKAAHLDGSTPKGEREKILHDFEHGDIMILCNVGIASTGVDIPAAGCVQILRPTKSLSLYLQMVGRGSRPNGVHDDYIHLDHAGNIIEHGRPNRFIDWEKHFVGKRKRKKKKINGEEIPNMILLEVGKITPPRTQPIGASFQLVDIPDNLKGVDAIIDILNQKKKTEKSGSRFAPTVVPPSKLFRALTKSLVQIEMDYEFAISNVVINPMDALKRINGVNFLLLGQMLNMSVISVVKYCKINGVEYASFYDDSKEKIGVVGRKPISERKQFKKVFH